jgi:hypothetical protein
MAAIGYGDQEADTTRYPRTEATKDGKQIHKGTAKPDDEPKCLDQRTRESQCPNRTRVRNHDSLRERRRNKQRESKDIACA